MFGFIKKKDVKVTSSKTYNEKPLEELLRMKEIPRSKQGEASLKKILDWQADPSVPDSVKKFLARYKWEQCGDMYLEVAIMICGSMSNMRGEVKEMIKSSIADATASVNFVNGGTVDKDKLAIMERALEHIVQRRDNEIVFPLTPEEEVLVKIAEQALKEVA